MAVPLAVNTCCSFIDEDLQQEGLFRISGSKSRMDAAIRKFDLGCLPDLASLGIHGVCGILKQYFRELPETIFPKSMYATIRALDKQSLLNEVKLKLLPTLDPIIVMTFSRLFKTLNLVHLSSSKNRMTIENLAIIWTPNFLKSTDMMLNSSDYSIFQAIVRIMIEQYNSLFYLHQRFRSRFLAFCLKPNFFLKQNLDVCWQSVLQQLLQSKRAL